MTVKVWVGLGVLLMALVVVSVSVPKASLSSAQSPEQDVETEPSEPVAEAEPVCREQSPNEFLIRQNYLPRRGMSREERAQAQENFRRSVRFRTENYGYFEGFGQRAWNSRTPQDYGERVRVFGLPVRLNRRIIPAVRCAEAEVARSCGDVPYTPVRLSGLRDRNTYHSHEVSNHVYGIALDIDPHLNTCCGCTARWREHPLCQRQVDSIYDRMAMPECWVRAFEKYGFYWLGHDTLRDTMHFEFLADPNRVHLTSEEVAERNALEAAETVDPREPNQTSR